MDVTASQFTDVQFSQNGTLRRIPHKVVLGINPTDLKPQIIPNAECNGKPSAQT